jgi:hypothetical protein
MSIHCLSMFFVRYFTQAKVLFALGSALSIFGAPPAAREFVLLCQRIKCGALSTIVFISYAYK